MSYIVWNDELATGINVIDGQHKRIIHYINQLTDAKNLEAKDIVGEVLVELIDYTLSHFAFEESLMDDADYKAADIHKRTHDAFRDKIRSYKTRHEAGEDVSEELHQLLNVWLMSHIAEDDNSYVPVVIQNIAGINTTEKEGWIRSKVQQFFN